MPPLPATTPHCAAKRREAGRKPPRRPGRFRPSTPAASGRSSPKPPAAKTAYAYYREQAAKYWPAQTRYLQAQIALALHRTDAKAPAAADILRALAENALHSPELGMYWKEVRGGYYWREAPTETQATLIEAFDEVKKRPEIGG